MKKRIIPTHFIEVWKNTAIKNKTSQTYLKHTCTVPIIMRIENLKFALYSSEKCQAIETIAIFKIKYK